MGHRRLTPCAALLIACAGTASADIDVMVFTITATNADGSAYFSHMIEANQASGNIDFDWNLNGLTELRDENNGMLVAELQQASVNIIADPEVAVGFTAFAPTQQTTFNVQSTILSFTQISAANAVGQASASITLNDFSGDGQVTFTPGAGGAYEAQLNNRSVIFDTLFDAGPIVGTNVFNDDTGGLAPLGIAVTSISAEWNFTVSSGDLVSGSSLFRVIPAPGSAALLGLGGLVASRRRR
ncbi:MAG: hypothetical protein AAGB48_11090 [Planctomycetota bacterium]